MKKILLSAALFAVSFITFAQIGINTQTPEGILDVVSTDSGLVVPRVANIAAVTTPVNGTIVYDITSNCIRTYENGAWSICLSGGANGGTVSNDCDTNGFKEELAPIQNIDASGNSSFSVTLTNNSFAEVGVIFSSDDLVLSGDNSSDLTVGTPSPLSISNWQSGGSLKVTYPLIGTPTTLGTLTGTWTKFNLSCTKTTPIVKGDAAFTLLPIDPILSIGDTNVDIQGVIDNATNKITIDIPYTGGHETYDAYTSAAVVATGESADTNNITISYPAGTFSDTGSITVTVVVDGDGTFNVKKQLFNVLETIGTFDFQVNGISKGNIVLQASGGITDRNFVDADHKFIYTSVTNPTTGKTWLSNNLGAHYTNVNHAAFDPKAQATASYDFKAYGSLFQWGRYSDGHALINWTSATGSDGAEQIRETTTTSASTTVGHDDFILRPYEATGYWYTGPPLDLWKGEGSLNNPCPVGYRVPSAGELNVERVSWSPNNGEVGAINSPLKLSSGGDRNEIGGNLEDGYGNYQTHSENFVLTISSSSYFQSEFYSGIALRCIKD